jgi:hypothetical protein
MEELLDIRRDLLVRLPIRQAPLKEGMTWCGKVCARRQNTPVHRKIQPVRLLASGFGFGEARCRNTHVPASRNNHP